MTNRSSRFFWTEGSLIKLYCLVVALTFGAVLPAYAQVGTELDRFTPDPSGNGRGITVRGSTSTTAYYSTYGSEDIIYLVDLKTHSSQGK